MKLHVRRLQRLLRLAWHMLMGMCAAHVGLPVTNKVAQGGQYRIQQAVSKWWNYKLCRILNLRLHIEGTINTAPTLFVANHISWLDIPCLATVLNAHFVSKEEVRGWPIFGAMAARTSTLFLRRGDATVTSMVADQMTWSLLRKRSIVIFPEGTSSEGDSVLHFHARLFQSAIRSHAEVQAVAISFPHEQGVNPAAPFVGDSNLLDHLWRLLAEPVMEARLIFCQPLAAAGLPRRVLANRARAQVLASIEQVGNTRWRAQA